MERHAGGNDGTPREGQPIRAVADRMEWSESCVKDARNMHEAGSRRSNFEQ